MGLSSSIKSRRSKAHSTKNTTQLLTFCLRQDWFALPIQVAYRVIPMETLYGDSQTTDTRLILYQDQELPVLDLHYRLFGEQQFYSSTNETDPGYLLLIQNRPGELLGLSLDSQPMIRRIAQSAFKALPETYVSQSNIRCIKALIVPTETEPPLFLIDLEQLLAVQPILPPSVQSSGSHQS